jgi:hypothetical protein
VQVFKSLQVLQEKLHFLHESSEDKLEVLKKPSPQIHSLELLNKAFFDLQILQKDDDSHSKHSEGQGMQESSEISNEVLKKPDVQEHFEELSGLAFFEVQVKHFSRDEHVSHSFEQASQDEPSLK